MTRFARAMTASAAIGTLALAFSAATQGQNAANAVELPNCHEDRVLNHMSGQIDAVVDETLNGLWNYILVNMGDDLSDLEMDAYRVYEIGSAELKNASMIKQDIGLKKCRAIVYAVKIATGEQERWGVVHYTIFENPEAAEGISIATDFPSEIEEKEDL